MVKGSIEIQTFRLIWLRDVEPQKAMKQCPSSRPAFSEFSNKKMTSKSNPEKYSFLFIKKKYVSKLNRWKKD